MKVLLELLGDTSRLLNGVEGLQDFRPDARGRVRELLEQLHMESERILATLEESDDAPDQRGLFLKEVMEAISSKEHDVARGILQDAVTEFPNDFEFLNYLGLVCWEQGDLQAAESAYNRAVQSVFEGELDASAVSSDDDAILRAVEGRALALYRIGNLAEALQCFEWLGSHFGDEYVGCLYLAGEIHHLRGDISHAITHYREVPVEPAVLYNLGLAYFQDHRLDRAVETWVRAFVANIHIASILLDRYTTHEGCTPGYLGSKDYAKEFVDACLRLWHEASGSLRFLRRCFEHPRVQSHLDQCNEQGGERLLQAGDGAMECAGWLAQLQDEQAVEQISQSVVDRLTV